MDLNNANIIIFGGDNYNTLGMIRTLGEKKLCHVDQPFMYLQY